MHDLQSFWNANNSTIPTDRDPSAYAVERAKLFPPRSAICDLGAGNGIDGLFFASKGHRVTLLDISDKALEQAKARAAELGLNSSVKTICCDLNNGAIPLANGSFGIVYARLSLHYFVPPVLTKLFSEVYRIMRPGGSAYLTLKGDDDEQEMRYLKKEATTNGDGIFHSGNQIKTRFTREQLAAMLQTAGIAADEYSVALYVENFAGRKDHVRSGNTEMQLNEIIVRKDNATMNKS